MLKKKEKTPQLETGFYVSADHKEKLNILVEVEGPNTRKKMRGPTVKSLREPVWPSGKVSGW